jgi:hypothetical protein
MSLLACHPRLSHLISPPPPLLPPPWGPLAGEARPVSSPSRHHYSHCLTLLLLLHCHAGAEARLSVDVDLWDWRYWGTPSKAL